MKLLYIPPLGGGIRDLCEAGQHRRLLENYCSAWLKEFDEIIILSFFDEKLSDYADVKIPKGVTLVANTWRLHRYLYACLAPFIHRKTIGRTCIARVSQTTGSLPALAFKFFQKIRGVNAKVIMTYGYNYVLFASTRGRSAVLLARLHEAIGRLAADRWITTTSDLASHLQSKHAVAPHQIELIPNGVDLDLFRANEAIEIRPELRSVVFVGRLEAQKNLPFLLDCLSAAVERYRCELKLFIVGEGSLQKQLEVHKKSDRLGIEFVGRVEQSKLSSVLKGADLYVIASLFEGHPKAVLEAMACGLPVLGLEAQGVTSLLKAANQYTFKTQDEFVEKFGKLRSGEARSEASRLARDSVFKSFDLAKNIAHETNCLKQLTSI